MIEREELTAWLRLCETPQLGRDTARRLLAALGSPQAIFDASGATREQLVGSAIARQLTQVPERLDALVEATLAWQAGAPTGEARAVIALGDPRYPASLLQTADPPLVFYAQGQLRLLVAKSLAVVGSRNPTPQGLDNARAFSAHLSQAGLTIVSGLALGIDGAAHDGALTGPGSTIAVVGTGLDRVYPKRHLVLAHRIAEQGLLMSEYALGMPPLNHNFPQRNRIIAGLAQGTLVVEAALQSGSLITARLSLESGREVFAIPGSIHSPQSKGCHALIKQGAKLVETGDDILEELRWGTTTQLPLIATEPHHDSSSDDPLLAALGYEPVSLDALGARTGWSAAELNTRLLELELEGRVARLPGQLFQRLATA